MSPLLKRGDLLPRMLVDPPGPESRAQSAKLREYEAPGINTLYRGDDNILWQEAKGSCVLDVDGNRYLDLTAGFGVAAVGHRHPHVVEAVDRQSRRLIHALGDAAGHPLRARLAEELRDISGIGEAQTYFAISGADAVEVAVKTALLHGRGERRKILAFEPAYHGLTFGALAVSSRTDFRKPFAHHLTPELARLPFGGDLAAVADTLERGTVAAVLVEPIVGREGVLIPPPGWLGSVADCCRRTGTLLLTDEIFTGFGRTGRAFAGHHDNVTPDLLICGKALAGGLPIGAVIGHRDVMAAWTTPGEALHTATFVAHPLACAAALATLEVLRSDGLIQRTDALGNTVADRVKDWPERYDTLTDVRGRGLLWGLELSTAELAGKLSTEARRRGLLMLAGGAEGRVAQIVPALTITERQLEHALHQLEEILAHLDAAPRP
ncbi:MAG: aspartate aminotransferase family protein [Acidobacteriota bacterium]